MTSDIAVRDVHHTPCQCLRRLLWTIASTTGINGSLGKVIVNCEDANLDQVKAGMPWHYKKYQSEQSTADRDKYSDAERKARRQRLGLWRNPSPVAPWEYRQAKRERMNNLKSFIGKSTVRSDQ